MKLKNKKTGEIYELHEFCLYDDKGFAKRPFLKSLAELNEEWEDAPEEYWFVAGRGVVEHALVTGDENDPFDKGRKEIGNYFETKEEAELVVRKLKAWKRLKDKGFKFELWDYDGGNYQERIKTGRILFRITDDERLDEDLDLLFGGEE